MGWGDRGTWGEGIGAEERVFYAGRIKDIILNNTKTFSSAHEETVTFTKYVCDQGGANSSLKSTTVTYKTSPVHKICTNPSWNTVNVFKYL